MATAKQRQLAEDIIDGIGVFFVNDKELLEVTDYAEKLKIVMDPDEYEATHVYKIESPRTIQLKLFNVVGDDILTGLYLNARDKSVWK